MSLPPATAYKDLHAGMKDSLPNITKGRIQDYLGQFRKLLDHKVQDLYNERWLRCLRIANHGNVVYISSVVWAEMKKSTSYKADISLNTDGIVQEAQCECGAGQGPNAHCKHMAAILFGLSEFCKTGDILTELTCTQKLQTFHKSDNFKGSPIKSSDFQTIRGKNALVYDPRPVHMRNSVETADRFRTACVNFRNKASQVMPVLQLFPPANIPALCHDHAYLSLTPEHQYLKDQCVTFITADKSAQIEQSTRGQGQNQTWRDTRLHHITSSNFGAICKATHRRDMASLAKSMTVFREINSKSIMHGKKYEPVAAEKFELKWGVKTEECGIFISEDNPQLAASPDRIIGQETVLEIKCPYTSREERISPVTTPYLKEVDGVLTLDKQHDYYYQVQGQLLCTKREHCVFVVYTFKDIVRLDIVRDDEFIEKMTEKLMDFYNIYFESALLNRFLYRNYYDHDFE